MQSISALTALFKPFQLLQDYFHFPFTEAQNEKAKLFWIVRLRWLVITALMLLGPIGLVFGILSAQTIVFYSGVLGVLFCFNFLTQWIWFSQSKKVGPIMVAYQLTIDLFVLAGLLLMTGGMTNPFFILFYINVALGATLLEGRRNVVFLVLSHQALFVVQMISYSKDLSFFGAMGSYNSATFLIQHFILFVSWWISRSLGRSISYQQNQLMNIKIHSEKMDRLRALGALAAGFSHEFASPLNTIKLRLEREQRASTNENLKLMSEAVSQCENVLRMMNSSQMDTREMSFEKKELNQFLNFVVQSWKKDFPHVPVQIQNLNAMEALFVKIPTINFSLAILNILDNAAEAHVETSIKLKISATDDDVEVQFLNSHSEFSKDVMNRFGEPFVTTKKMGTGLGLYSVQLFAQSAGGDVRLFNEIHDSISFAGVKLKLPRLKSAEGSHVET